MSHLFKCIFAQIFIWVFVVFFSSRSLSLPLSIFWIIWEKLRWIEIQLAGFSVEPTTTSHITNCVVTIVRCGDREIRGEKGEPQRTFNDEQLKTTNFSKFSHSLFEFFEIFYSVPSWSYLPLHFERKHFRIGFASFEALETNYDFINCEINDDKN